MAWPLLLAGLGGAALSMYSSYRNEKENFIAKQQALAEEKAAAMADFAFLSESLALTKKRAGIDAGETIDRITLTGGSDLREAKLDARSQMHSLAAQSEGLTSGISQAKVMIANNIQMQKQLYQLQTESVSMISSVLDKHTQTVNEINNQKNSAFRELQGVLAKTTPRASSSSRMLSMLSSGVSGAQSGASLYGAFKNA